jgi:hypothetical protein
VSSASLGLQKVNIFGRHTTTFLVSVAAGNATVVKSKDENFGSPATAPELLGALRGTTSYRLQTFQTSSNSKSIESQISDQELFLFWFESCVPALLLVSCSKMVPFLRNAIKYDGKLLQ